MQVAADTTDSSLRGIEQLTRIYVSCTKGSHVGLPLLTALNPFCPKSQRGCGLQGEQGRGQRVVVSGWQAGMLVPCSLPPDSSPIFQSADVRAGSSGAGLQRAVQGCARGKGPLTFPPGNGAEKRSQQGERLDGSHEREESGASLEIFRSHLGMALGRQRWVALLEQHGSSGQPPELPSNVSHSVNSVERGGPISWVLLALVT